MRRVTKKLFLFLFGVIFTGIFCEFLIYYVVIAQCSWPVLQGSQEHILNAFILADTHLLGPRRGHWLDKWRREWQMHQAFQAVITVHKPDVVFVLGDLFDEGEWVNEKQFEDYVKRFHRLFALPQDIPMYVVAGNHDIGFHHYMSWRSVERFTESMNATSVELVTIKQSDFVLLNSMAMHGDRCSLCMEARRKLKDISDKLDCSKNPTRCRRKGKNRRPILMQHFPLYRQSDSACTEPDAPPLPERNKPFRDRIDALSHEATEFLIEKIKPRVVFGGHTHHGCLLRHSRQNNQIEFQEFSVPSFSWRNRPDPKFMLVTISPDDYLVNKCALPTETAIVLAAVILLASVSTVSFRMRLVGNG